MPDIYEGDLTTVIDSVWAGLPEVVQTSGRVFVPIGNGHAAWEMALSNTLSRGDHVLVLNCGRFAAIWAEMAEFNGLNVEVMEAEEGFAMNHRLLKNASVLMSIARLRRYSQFTSILRPLCATTFRRFVRRLMLRAIRHYSWSTALRRWVASDLRWMRGALMSRSRQARRA